MRGVCVVRRGAPCWYKREEVELIAINDAFLLLSAAKCDRNSGLRTQDSQSP